MKLQESIRTPFILYVEDNADDVLLLKVSLELSDFFPNLQVVRDGASAVDYLGTLVQERQDCPDLILLDLNLPRMNGYEVIEKLKDTPAVCSIPIIIFTGSLNPEDHARCVELKVNDYWAKPKNLNETLGVAKRLKEYSFYNQKVSF
jgi:two-component system, chemotaxis family, response regulator Rcp1